MVTMSKLRRAWEIHREEGAPTLINKSLTYIKNKIQRYLWLEYYNIKSLIVRNHVVNINNILIDLDDEVFSSQMKKVIRMNRYEYAEAELVSAYINRDHPVIDLGAGVGYVTCIIDRKADDSTPVLAVEANESLIPVIKKTKSLNESDFDIIYSAYDSASNSVDFQVQEDFWSSSQYIRKDKFQKEVTVPAVSIDEMIREYNLECPIQLVMDIEGAEINLFDNESHILQNGVSVIIFEYHSFTNETFEYYSRILEGNGFEFVESQGDVYVYQNINIWLRMYDHESSARFKE